MKTYHFTSAKFEGFVKLIYDDHELLCSYDITSAQLTEEQKIWLLKRLPRELAELSFLLSKMEGGKITEVTIEVTFEVFWKRYNDAARSSKKKTEKIWKKMNVHEQLKAYNFIGNYEASISNGIAKKYATTYLNDELWNN